MAQNGTVAYVNTLPECDLCKLAGTDGEKQSPARAEFDFRTRTGPWAYGCRPHYETYRMHSELGVGMGQKLEVRPDIVGPVVTQK